MAVTNIPHRSYQIIAIAEIKDFHIFTSKTITIYLPPCSVHSWDIIALTYVVMIGKLISPLKRCETALELEVFVKYLTLIEKAI